jgi:hypothetical protein
MKPLSAGYSGTAGSAFAAYSIDIASMMRRQLILLAAMLVVASQTRAAHKDLDRVEMRPWVPSFEGPGGAAAV